jgi:hypothetical protein
MRALSWERLASSTIVSMAFASLFADGNLRSVIAAYLTFRSVDPTMRKGVEGAALCHKSSISFRVVARGTISTSPTRRH